MIVACGSFSFHRHQDITKTAALAELIVVPQEERLDNLLICILLRLHQGGQSNKHGDNLHEGTSIRGDVLVVNEAKERKVLFIAEMYHNVTQCIGNKHRRLRTVF